MTQKPPPQKDDLALFRAEMNADGVQPIAPVRQVSHARPKPRPIPLQSRADEAAVPADSLRDTSGWDLDIDTGDLVSYLRTGLPGDILKKLRRGHWAIQASIDLHGATVDQARTELARFLAEGRHAGLRCVRVVHGKGTRSPGQVPVIRNKVRLSLAQRDEVLAFCDAHPADGGSGAVVVLLKSG
ncbi:MAG: Smr/MutS family protein [Betaproteobacteria bacterium]|nr:Smr/MutS family protein [Betaproteobacteria bacterium]